jgi:hypothetical protein
VTKAFQLDIKGFDGIMHVLDKYGAQLMDLRPFWRLCEQYIAPTNAVKVFTEGQSSWAGYKNPRYRNWKYQHGYYLTKLRKSGKLYDAFKIPHGPGNLSKITMQSWTYGVDLNYPEFANRSSYPALHNVGEGNMPKREWALVSTWMQERLRVMFYRYITSIMRNEPIKL